jgi:hypothetical protein
VGVARTVRDHERRSVKGFIRRFLQFVSSGNQDTQSLKGDVLEKEYF